MTRFLIICSLLLVSKTHTSEKPLKDNSAVIYIQRQPNVAPLGLEEYTKDSNPQTRYQRLLEYIKNKYNPSQLHRDLGMFGLPYNRNIIVVNWAIRAIESMKPDLLEFLLSGNQIKRSARSLGLTTGKRIPVTNIIAHHHNIRFQDALNNEERDLINRIYSYIGHVWRKHTRYSINNLRRKLEQNGIGADKKRILTSSDLLMAIRTLSIQDLASMSPDQEIFDPGLILGDKEGVYKVRELNNNQGFLEFLEQERNFEMEIHNSPDDHRHEQVINELFNKMKKIFEYHASHAKQTNPIYETSEIYVELASGNKVLVEKMGNFDDLLKLTEQLRIESDSELTTHQRLIAYDSRDALSSIKQGTDIIKIGNRTSFSCNIIKEILSEEPAVLAVPILKEAVKQMSISFIKLGIDKGLIQTTHIPYILEEIETCRGTHADFEEIKAIYDQMEAYIRIFMNRSQTEVTRSSTSTAAASSNYTNHGN